MTTLTLPGVLELTKTFPRSPNELLGDYVILGRTIDKCRASIAGQAGVYHWDCGLSMLFFEFKGIDMTAFKAKLETGATDEQMLAWIEEVGISKTQEEILAWGYDSKWAWPGTTDKKAYMEGVVRSLNLKNPYIQSWFQMLDAEEGRLLI